MSQPHCPLQGTPDIIQCPYCGCSKHFLMDERIYSIECLDCDKTWLSCPEQFLNRDLKRELVEFLAEKYNSLTKERKGLEG